MAALAFEGLSFPLMLETLFRDPQLMNEGTFRKLKRAFLPEGMENYNQHYHNNKNNNKDGNNGEEEKEITLKANVTAEDLMPLYVSIRRFCKPYPACVTSYN
eukprot:scaffold875_cov183-Ochromonas_danica.AAC.9